MLDPYNEPKRQEAYLLTCPASVFNTSLGTWRILMHEKKFDPYNEPQRQETYLLTCPASVFNISLGTWRILMHKKYA